ncbi:MAG: hypothetical protein GXO93_07955 [FCB group bacterium]|nr:hypothetical protein [FCB group bacterium]
MDNFIKILEGILPYLIGVGLPIYTLKHTRKMKELEIAEHEKDRNFQIEKNISEEAIKIMAESYHLAHKINRGLNSFNNVDEETKEKIYKEVVNAREYWEKNLFYLPESSRRLIISLTNMTFASFNGSQSDFVAQSKAFEKVSKLFTNIEMSFEVIMKKYNIFDF